MSFYITFNNAKSFSQQIQSCFTANHSEFILKDQIPYLSLWPDDSHLWMHLPFTVTSNLYILSLVPLVNFSCIIRNSSFSSDYSVVTAVIAMVLFICFWPLFSALCWHTAFWKSALQHLSASLPLHEAYLSNSNKAGNVHQWLPVIASTQLFILLFLYDHQSSFTYLSPC